MGETRVQVSGERVGVSVSLAALYLWEVENGRLYGLSLCLMDGDAYIDTVNAYVGIRSISEFGGIGFASQGDTWAYGNAPKTREAFLDRLDGLTDAPLARPAACECEEQ